LETIASILRQARASRKLLLREVGAAVAVDPSLLSKYEKGERLPTRGQLHRFSQFYQLDEEQLTTVYLSDKIVRELEDSPQAMQALQLAWDKITEEDAQNALKVAEERVTYKTQKK